MNNFSSAMVIINYIYLHAELSINLMRGRLVEVNGLELLNLEQGARVFGDVKIMIAGLYTVVNSTDFLIKWDMGKFFIKFNSIGIFKTQFKNMIFYFKEPDYTL